MCTDWVKYFKTILGTWPFAKKAYFLANTEQKQFLHENNMLKRPTNLDRHGPIPVPNICHLSIVYLLPVYGCITFVSKNRDTYAKLFAV